MRRVDDVRPTDCEIIRVVEDSYSFGEASERLGWGTTWIREQAARLGVRTRFRLGIERLPPDETLARMLRQARSVQALATTLGVTRRLLQEHADRLGIDARIRVRPGLPDDATLRRELLACIAFREVAERYGVQLHAVRNQARRLGVPSPSRRVVMRNVA